MEREQTLKWRRELFNNSQIQFPCLRFPNDILSFHSIPVLRGCRRRQSLLLLWSDGVKTGKDAGYRRKKSDVTQTGVSSIGVTNASSCF